MRKTELFQKISEIAQKDPKDFHSEVRDELRLSHRNARRLIAQWERRTGKSAPAPRAEYDTSTKPA